MTDRERFSKILWKSRMDAGVSQEYMANSMNLSRKTIWNWENGVSFPDFFQGAEWFKVLGLNPMKYYYSYAFPDLDGIDGSITDEEVDSALCSVISVLSIEDKRRLLYMLYGNHGSSPSAILNLVNAHLQVPLRDRIIQANTILKNYKMEEMVDNLTNMTNIRPNTKAIETAIDICTESVIKEKKGYSVLTTKD